MSIFPDAPHVPFSCLSVFWMLIPLLYLVQAYLAGEASGHLIICFLIPVHRFLCSLFSNLNCDLMIMICNFLHRNFINIVPFITNMITHKSHMILIPEIGIHREDILLMYGTLFRRVKIQTIILFLVDYFFKNSFCMVSTYLYPIYKHTCNYHYFYQS